MLCGPDFMSIYELVESVAEYFGLSMATVTRVDSSTLNQRVTTAWTGLLFQKQ